MSIIITLSLIVSFTTCYFATPTVFGGRDQGAIATAAINLAKYKSFTFSTPESRDLFQKYGPGKALNYPGFNYTKDGQLTTRFPKAYVAYLAGCYSLFGLKGIQFANFIPLFLFFILFWLTLRELFDDKISFLGFLTAVTFFSFLWFAKYTLTEIFMLFLIWAGIFFLIACRRRASADVDVGRLQISLAFFGLSALTRIEGIVFFLMAVGYIHILNRKKIITFPKNFNKFLLISILFLLILYLFLNFPALSDSLKNIAKAFLPNSTKDSAPSINLYSHLLTLFFSYGIFIYLILGLAGIVLLGANLKQNWKKPEFLAIFVLFPSFFYFVSPLVSLDDPWIFRRFVFAIFPILIFYTLYFLEKFFRHKAFSYLIIAALIIANTIVSWHFLFFSENKNLLPQAEEISQKFKKNDLILIDRLASGSGFSLISEPMQTLYNKQAIYFFNAEDLKYVKRENYQNIYLIAPLDAKPAWYDNLNRELVDTVSMNNNYLEESSVIFSIARNTDITTVDGIWKIIL